MSGREADLKDFVVDEFLRDFPGTFTRKTSHPSARTSMQNPELFVNVQTPMPQTHSSKTDALFQTVKSDVSLPAQEEQMIALWDQGKIFEKSVDAGSGKPTFTFYDGPPFATGLPHYGHLLQGILKDAIPRYWTMKGYSVPRRFGWDCHGLPVEYEINKAYKIDSRKDVLKMGVDKYNAACRSIVDRCASDWKKTVRRIGRWIDMDHPYFTMDVSFMNSVWWVFQELHKKGLIYEGYKVVPYSTGISTALSNFEANQNYKTVQDPAVTVTFPVIGGPHAGAAILAWTTTPWTLPSNLALAVGNEITYAKVKEKSTGRVFILAEKLLSPTWKKPADEVDVLETFAGSQLVGLKYTPLLEYFLDREAKGAFRVIHSDHVTIESGTGIVHMAPAFGEEDYFACKTAGIPLVNPVDDDGMFTAEVPDFQGRRVKEADKDIILKIKKLDRLFKQETIEHSYPFCYRSDTPLIYRAVSSWFVSVEKFRDQLVAANKKTNWVPEHIRDGRFGNWLENARDWAISRNRFWGTPLPLWRNVEGEIICVGSREELEKLSGKKVNDLHIEVVDQIEIPSPTGKSPLRRVEGVLDCWFESGSMPYAQFGYPYQNVENFKKAFPADFIGEGQDQTRGWFYTLTVIGTALFGQSPFKNVVVTGMILAEDGRKMSKSLKNYPDPQHILDAHGADALRLYLIDSPVVKGQEIRFSETGVRDIVRKILLRWWNSYSFFTSYANIDGFKPRGDAIQSPNILDQWLQSRMHSLIENTEREMAAYRLYNVVPKLLQFIEDLTNTYIRFNRSHFWQDGMPEDKRLAYETLYETLLTLSKVMAPFAPFMAEVTYQNLSKALPENQRKESVHLDQFPTFKKEAIRPDLEEAVTAMEALVTLGRNQREKISVKAKIPLRKLKIIHRSQKVLDTLKKFEPYFTDELNVQAVEYDVNEDAYIQISAKPNFPVLGKRFGPKMKAASAVIQGWTLENLLKIEKGESIEVEGQAITASDLEIRRAPKGENPNLAVHSLISMELDPTVTPEQEREGLAREVIRKVQAARKSADFKLDDRIALEIGCSGSLREAIETHRETVCSETLTKEFKLTDVPTGTFLVTEDLDGVELKIGVRALPRA